MLSAREVGVPGYRREGVLEGSKVPAVPLLVAGRSAASMTRKDLIQ